MVVGVALLEQHFARRYVEDRRAGKTLQAFVGGERSDLGEVAGEQVEIVECRGVAMCAGQPGGANHGSFAGVRGSGDATDDLKRENNQRGTGRESGREKPWADDGRIPKRPAAKANVEERRDGMNGDGPDDRDEDEGYIEPLRRLLPLVSTVKQIAADPDIKQEVAIEHKHVPTQ